MKAVLMLLVAMILSVTLQAQEIPKIPKDYILDKKEDYKPYEAKVIELIQWLEASPIGLKKKARAEASQFIFDWINGSPYVTIAFHEKAYIGLLEERYLYTNELVLTYQFAMTLHVLQNPDKKYNGTETDLQTVGVRKMVAAYEKAKNKSHSPAMAKFQKMIKKKKLAAWVKKNISFDNMNMQNMPTRKKGGKKT